VPLELRGCTSFGLTIGSGRNGCTLPESSLPEKALQSVFTRRHCTCRRSYRTERLQNGYWQVRVLTRRLPGHRCILSARANWRSQGESRTWIRRLHSYGSAASLKFRNAAQSWCIYRLLRHRLRAAETDPAGPERFTSVSPSEKVTGSLRCCAGFRVVRLITLRSAGEPRLRGHFPLQTNKNNGQQPLTGIRGLYSLTNHGALFRRIGDRVCSWPSRQSHSKHR